MNVARDVSSVSIGSHAFSLGKVLTQHFSLRRFSSFVSRSFSITWLLQWCVLILAADIVWPCPPLTLQKEDLLDCSIVRRRFVCNKRLSFYSRRMIWLRQLFDNCLPSCSLGILKEHVDHTWNATVLTPLTTTIGNPFYRVWELAQKSAFLNISPGKQWWSPRLGHHGRKGLSTLRFGNWTLGLFSFIVATSVTLGKLQSSECLSEYSVYNNSTHSEGYGEDQMR